MNVPESVCKEDDVKVAKRGLCMTQTGTPYYASPEVWRDMPYDAACLSSRGRLQKHVTSRR